MPNNIMYTEGSKSAHLIILLDEVMTVTKQLKTLHPCNLPDSLQMQQGTVCDICSFGDRYC